MKLLFLVCRQEEVRRSGAVYDFLPYKYGPYSFMADRDLATLISEGMIWGERLLIKDEGRAAALELYGSLSKPVQQQIRSLIQSYQKSSDRDLIDDVYDRYPRYTVLSALIQPPPRFVAAPAVYTVGYEGSSIDAFLHALIAHGITRVLDVRKNPVSRRYGFSKTRFAAYCEKIGVEYQHFAELGIPSEERQGLSDFESYQTLFDHYDRDMLPEHSESVRAVSALMERSPSVLMCFEADPNYCHRSYLARKISKWNSLPITHIEVRHVREETGANSGEDIPESF